MAIGCYTEPYVPAIYKGVTFKAKSVSSTHGRRGAEGEFPFGEQTGYADMGRKIRRYKLSGRFDSNLHVVEAAALILVCEANGPGLLVHPTRGIISKAACTSLEVRDEIEEDQGVTYVDMEFVEANEWPNGLSLLGQLFGIVIGTIIGSAKTHFSANYKPSEIQTFRKEAVVNVAQAQMSIIRAAYEAATTDNDTDQTRNKIINDMVRIQTDNDLAGDTETMSRGLSLGMNAVAIELSGLDQYRVFKNIANSAAMVSSFASPASEAENAIYSTVRIIAASYMAEGITEAANARSSEVYDAIDAIGSILDQEIEYARSLCDNFLQSELSTFKTDALAKLYKKAYDSPGLVQYDFGGRLHPVAAAYSIYGDAKRHRELETLNNIGATGRIDRLVAANRIR